MSEHKYQEALREIDSMCQIQLGQVNASITSMLRAMESPEFWRQPLAIRESLGLMQYLADDLMNFVNATAEAVGCNFVDDIDRARETRILEAFRVASKEEVDHASKVEAIRG